MIKNMMLQIPSDKQHWAGTTRILPVIGETNISKDGVLEASDAEAQKLMDKIPGFSILDAQGNSKKSEPESEPIEKDDEEEIGRKSEQPEKIEKDDGGEQLEDTQKSEPLEPKESEPASALDSMNKADLQSVAKQAELEESEWKYLNKQQLKDYLKSKIDI